MTTRARRRDGAKARSQVTRLIGYVRVIDLSLAPRAEGYPLCPFLEISATDTHIEALMRMHATNEPLAKVVDAAGVTVGILSAAQLHEPLFRGGT